MPGSVKIQSITSSGFQVFLDANSTPRDLVSGALTFTAASGAQLTGCTPNCTFQLSTDPNVTAWFASTNATGVANGGAYSLTVPFTFTGDTNAIATLRYVRAPRRRIMCHSFYVVTQVLS